MKRADRRHKKKVKFLNRLRNQIRPLEYWWTPEGTKRILKVEIIKEALEGKGCYQKLRSMSTRCSCSMCAHYKYERKEYKKETLRELGELQ